MSNPRIEEISSSSSDSDPSEVEVDPSTFTPSSASIRTLRHHHQQPASSQQQNLPSRPATNEPLLQPQNPLTHQQQQQQQQRPFNPQPPPDYKTYACLYPLYFDSSRSRQEGRRVSTQNAVPNPLAREIVDAVQAIDGGKGRLKTVFEPGKTHPRDWANPGRVRVAGIGGAGGGGGVKNKHHLYILVSAYLKSHPSTPHTPLRLRIQGMPAPEGPVEPPAVPLGWKMGKVLPLHSPALSGGGISENILRDMMQEMQGAEGQSGGGRAGGGMVEAGGGGGGANAGQGKRKREGGKKKQGRV